MPEKKRKFYYHIKTTKLLVIVLAVIAFIALAYSAISFVKIYRDLHQQDLLRPMRQWNDDAHRREQGVNTIRDWMTFYFINDIFYLRPDYLRDELGITDNQYPKISIDSWAKKSYQDPEELVAKIRMLIRDYQLSTPTPSNI